MFVVDILLFPKSKKPGTPVKLEISSIVNFLASISAASNLEAIGLNLNPACKKATPCWLLGPECLSAQDFLITFNWSSFRIRSVSTVPLKLVPLA